MKRLVLLTITVFIFLTLFLAINSDAAIMEDYCQVPPYVIQNVAPNVMIVLDNSGSMFRIAYYDGFTTPANTGDDNLCTNSGSPCTGFSEPGLYPSSCAEYVANPDNYYKYYGYYNPDYWYTYSSNRFVPTAPKTGSCVSGARAKAGDEWDGNFLNWLTMRRVDVIRKVMTGGKTTTGEGSGYDRLIGEKADCDDRGKYKRINNAQNYTAYSGNRKFYVYSADAGCGGGGSGTSYFGIRNASDGSDGTGNEATFNVAVRVPVPVEGVLQSVVGARARLGLSFYRVNTGSSNQGGFVQVYISGGSLSSTVNQINLTRPGSNTPLAETLWTTTGYFAQTDSISGMGSPGPRYSSGDYQINNAVDPLNYGTGGQPRYPSCAKSFVLYITDGEPCADGYLPANLRDYASGTNFNCSGTSCPARSGTAPETYTFPASTFTSCSGENNSSFCNGVVSGCYVAGIEDVALYTHTTDLRSATIGKNDMPGKQVLTLYTVFAWGTGSTLLKYATINGGFEDINGNNIPDLQSEWDENGDGVPDTYFEAKDGSKIEKAVKEAFMGIIKRASSGTAASVLASGEGQGANLVQAVFYPRRRIGNDIIAWAGALQNLWYYVDPFFTKSDIREDSVYDQKLHLIEDYIMRLYFDTTFQTVRARLCSDSDGDGDPDANAGNVQFENIKNLWETGELLWSRNISLTPRTIYTTINGSSFLAGNFSIGNASTLREYLQTSTDAEAENIIRFTHGEDIIIDANADGINDYRLRTVTIGSDTHVWKLGDILDSTPKIASWIPLHNYDKVYVYSDYTYKSYVDSNGYKNRGMVFAGGNDGMLHAFKLGKLELDWSGRNAQLEMARLTNPDASTPIGHEMWAFIPKNTLPYLKYITDPEYCHVYSIDLAPYVFDASIGGNPDDDKTVSSWKTVLVGGMRYGGACRGTSTACSDVSGDGSKDCVNTPVDVGGTSVGYSSYFALDITDQNNPTLLWEFSEANIPVADRGLGFTTTGPAVVRIGADKTKNGKWFVVFGSGPTGPIDTANWQFLARSDQNLRLFVLDLKTGNLERTVDTGIQYAFAGSMLNSTVDFDLDYQDDVIYIGYVKKCTATTSICTSGTWTDGGVGRLITKSDTNPGSWKWSQVMDGIGPVTSSVVQLQHKTKGISWLFFATGRYYYTLQGGVVDDADGQRTLFGIKEPCFSISGLDNSCTTTVGAGTITDVTDVANVPSNPDDPNFKGWKINLELSGNYAYYEGASVGCVPPLPAGSLVTKEYKSERMITDPMATISGIVFFTTFKPYADECGVGGKSFIWAVKYSTGGAAGAALKGKALLQVSTASIEQVDLSTAFTEKGKRRTAALEGVPPTSQGLSILSTPPPIKRVIHMRER